MATSEDQAGATAASRRLHPASPLFDVVSLGRQLLAPGVLALSTGGLRLLVVGVLVVLALRVGGWWRRTYALDAGVLRVSSGWFVRREEVVPGERIQQVGVVRKLRHRLLGVATLRVELAGGGGAVTLEVLDDAEAARVRDTLLAAKERAAPTATSREASSSDVVATGRAASAAEAGPEPAWVPAEWPIVRLRYRDLAVAGVTGAQLLVLLGVVASVVTLVGEVGGDLGTALDDLQLPAVGPLVVAVAVAAGVVLWLGSAVTASILADGGFTLSLIGDELHVRRGLLDQKEAVVPLARVQVVRVAASPLRRLLGLVSVRVDSAGGGGEASRVVVPVLPERDVERVLGLVLPGSTPLPPLRPAPPPARRRRVLRAVAPATALGALVAVAVPPWGLLALAVVLPAWALGRAAYAALGHAVSEGFLVARRGAVVRTTTVMPVARAQSVRLRASPLQRRMGLATVHVDVAGPGANPRVIDETRRRQEAVVRLVVH